MLNAKNGEILGTVEIVSNAVIQQVSLVFQNGGGSRADVNFGLIYFGQTSEILAFLVNNGPKVIRYFCYFHPNKKANQINYNEANFAVTPYEVGEELTIRSLGFSPTNQDINPFEQIPVKFSSFKKPPTINKGWRNAFSADTNLINNANDDDDEPLECFSTLVIKFESLKVESKPHFKLDQDKKKNHSSEASEIGTIT